MGIRLCCPGQEWHQTPGAVLKISNESDASYGGLLASPSDPRSRDDIPAAKIGQGGELAKLTTSVEEAALKTNQHLVALLMGQYALGEHCLALRRFMLLGQGDFVEALMDAAQEELQRDAEGLYRHQLLGVVDGAVRQSNAQYCSSETLSCLGVKLLQPSSGECGWDIFMLEYNIESPLHVVLTPIAMEQYDRAFMFMWKLRRVSHSLASCWSQNMALQRHIVSSSRQFGNRASELRLEMRQTLHKCTCLRNEMHHFVQNIQSYIMCEVIETSWAKLQAGWKACTDLDQVILEHQRYLTCIEEGAFLAVKAEPVHTALSSLFSSVLEFTDLHNQVCHSAFEAVELLNAEPGGTLPFARSLAECRAQLDQNGAKFLIRLQHLLRALETMPSLRQLSSDLRFLVCRLDFNSYYEQKRTANFSERIRVG